MTPRAAQLQACLAGVQLPAAAQACPNHTAVRIKAQTTSICRCLWDQEASGGAATCVDAHGVQVFDGADDDHIVGHVPHHLQLELLPPDQALLDQHLHARIMRTAEVSRQFCGSEQKSGRGRPMECWTHEQIWVPASLGKAGSG